MSKLFCRVSLILALAAITYVALLPAYDFGQWVPATLLKTAQFPRAWIELLMVYADKIAHSAAALIITLLYFLSLEKPDNTTANIFKLPRMSPTVFLAVLFLLAFTVELIQLWVGRNFSLADIFAGVAGGLVALLCINETNDLRASSQTRP